MAVMFYGTILFCSLAGVVGAITSLAEINTEKKQELCRKEKGSPNSRVPHCHLAALALASQNTRDPARSRLTSLCLYAGTHKETRPSFLSAFYNQTWPLQNCLVWRKGEDIPQKKFKPNLALPWRPGVYTEACRFPPPTATSHGRDLQPSRVPRCPIPSPAAPTTSAYACPDGSP